MKYTIVIKSAKDFDTNWLVKLYNQLAFEKYIDKNSWHQYTDNAMLKNAKFHTALSAQKLEAKVKAVKTYIPDLIKQAKIYTDLSALTTGIYSRSIQNGGSTTYVDTGLAVNPTGYMVAKSNSNEQVISENDFSPRSIEQYIKQNINNLREENTFLGTWLNDGKWYLDSSERINGCILAMKLAIDRNQIAIYDLARNESIYTADFKDVKFPEGTELWSDGTSTYQDLLELKKQGENKL